jgi:TetR/AcrR family transcriptional regulator, cholesterol catabolism regulator
MMNVKDTLLNETFELFLKYGIKSVSMDDICKKLGISKKTIYQQISNKEELVSEVFGRHLEDDETQIKYILEQSVDAVDEMVKITLHVLAFLRSMKPSLLYDLKKYHSTSWEIIEKRHFSFIEVTILNNLIRGQKEGVYRKDFNPSIISKLYVNKSNCIVDEDVFPFQTFDRTLLFKETITYHLYGIVSEQGRLLLSKYQKTMSSL